MSSQTLGLQALFDAVTRLDTGRSMRGVSYQWCGQNTLDPSSWWIPMPYGDIPTPQKGGTAPKIAPLQEALLTAITSASQSSVCFIDISHLASSADAFMAPVIPELAKLINGMPVNSQPVVRYLTGSPNASVESFLDGDALVNGLVKSGWVTHPNARFFCGGFQPAYGSASAQLSEELAAAEVLEVAAQLKSSLSQSAANAAAVAEGLPTSVVKLARALQRLHASVVVPAFSWNHSKVFAVNGQSLVSGGANYWSDYSQGQTWIFDLSMALHGDATVATHHYLNHVWHYLADRPVLDQGSWCWGGRFLDKTLQPVQEVPVFGAAVTQTGTSAALMVARGGMWPDSPDGLSTQFLDAARDILFNVVAELAQAGHLRWATAVILFEQLADESAAWRALMESLGASSAAWATRCARNEAIRQARGSVWMAQQKLVMDDLVEGAPGFQALVARINAALGTDWNGYIWPYDLLRAMATAVSNMVGTGLPQAGVLLATSAYSNTSGYRDPIQSGDFISRLVSVAKGMADVKQLPRDAAAMQAAVAKLVHYQRVLPESKDNTSAAVQHSKFVCVDQQLAYIGSDNAYPSYNLEVGMWVDDAAALKALVSDYWTPLWALSEAVD